jgi:serine/threonine-protein kinase
MDGGIVRSESPRLRARSGSASTLPPDLLAAGVRRLGFVALLTAVFALVVTVVFRVAAAQTGQAPYHGIVLFGEIAILVASLGMFGLTRRTGLDPAELLDRALVYEVAMGFLFGAIHFSVPDAEGILPKGWSPVAVWTICFPLFVPSTRGKSALATVATAAMDPVGLLLAVALGYQRLPSAAMLAAMFLPTAIACVGGILGSRIMHGLSARAGRAEELGSYRLLAPIGRGGMGEVWRAEHRLLARPAAVKLVHPEKADGFSGAEMRARFEREAKVTAALRSPHTVQLYDYGVTDDGSFFYAMELLEGWPLDALVERFGPQPPERVVHILRQACRSLEEAHRAGLVHRDVKPSNLFLCRLGIEADFVKVLDFGLVKSSEGAESSLTATGVVAGTPAFLPPEMARGSGEVDGRADLYSLACVGYFLLAGAHVFERSSALATIHAHATEAPPLLSARTTQAIPAGLEDLLLECLEKRPEDRPASALELERRLSSVAVVAPWTREDADAWWARHAAATEPLTLPGAELRGGPQ